MVKTSPKIPGGGWFAGSKVAFPKPFAVGRLPAPRQGQRDGPWLPFTAFPGRVRCPDVRADSSLRVKTREEVGEELTGTGLTKRPSPTIDNV